VVERLHSRREEVKIFSGPVWGVILAGGDPHFRRRRLRRTPAKRYNLGMAKRGPIDPKESLDRMRKRILEGEQLPVDPDPSMTVMEPEPDPDRPITEPGLPEPLSDALLLAGGAGLGAAGMAAAGIGKTTKLRMFLSDMGVLPKMPTPTLPGLQKALSRASWNLGRAKSLGSKATWVEGGGEALPRMAQGVRSLKKALYPGGIAANEVLKRIQ